MPTSEPVRLAWILPALAPSAREARLRVTEALTGIPEDHLEVARLLTSELVANAVLHATGPIGLGLSTNSFGLRVRVRDHGRGTPLMEQQVVDASAGRGLLLVDHLATAWGVRQHATGKTVWFRLRT